MPGTLALALAQRAVGHEVFLAYDTKRGAFNDYEEAAAPWVEPHRLQPPVAFTLSAKSSVWEYLRDGWRLRRLLRHGDIDVLHLHLSHDHGLAALAGIPHHVVGVRTVHAARSLSRRFLQRWLLGRVRGLITRSLEHAQRLRELVGAANSSVAVIPGSIDTERFQPAVASAIKKARAAFDIPLDAPVVCHVALIAQRGQEELVRAAASLGQRAPYLLFVGKGEAEAALRRVVDASGIGGRVRFVGYLQGQALVEGYAAADAAFLAQPGNDASMRAALEAQACGLPVVGVWPALQDVVDATVGYPVTARTPEAIASGLSEWLDSLDEGRRRGVAARARVLAERSIAREAQVTLAFYDELRAQAR